MDTVAVLLAAGAGRRLGGHCKALLRVGGETLLARQCNAMQAAGIRDLVVMIGAEAEKVQRELAHLQDRCDGMTIQSVPVGLVSENQQDSVRAGVRFLSQHPGFGNPQQGVLFSLVDLPLLTSSDIAAVLQCAMQNGTLVVVPTLAAATDSTDSAASAVAQPGHPIWLSARLLQNVDHQQPEFSLKRLIAQQRADHAESVAFMASTAPGYFMDVDTPQDVADLAARYDLAITIDPA